MSDHNDHNDKTQIDVHLHGFDGEVMQTLKEIKQSLKELKVTDSEFKAILGRIDVSSNKTAANLEVMSAKQQEQANVQQEISDDLDRLIAGGAISGEAAAQLQTLADRLQVNSDKSDTIATVTADQVAFLKGLAAKSEPVVPEPPPAPVIP